MEIAENYLKSKSRMPDANSIKAEEIFDFDSGEY